jgi:protein phosphatase
MRILLISDIHGNIWALESILKREEYDILISLGDLVDYGPRPEEVVQIVKDKATFSVMGNHDYSLAFDAECPGTTEEYKKITNDLRDYFKYSITNDSINYLRNIPMEHYIEIDGFKIYLVHSSAKDPLGDYVTFDKDVSFIEEKMIPKDKNVNVVLYGHTHIPGIIDINGVKIVNPGSTGFPRDIPLKPSYAVIENGMITLKKAEYDFHYLVSEFKKARVPEKYQKFLLGESI